MEITTQYLYTGTELLSGGYRIIIEGDSIVGIEKIEYKPEFHTVTPAFIDAHSHIGMERWGECWEESDVNEKGESIVVFADALDSVQMTDPAFKDSVENGVLYSSVLPGSGNIISGRAAVIRNFASNTTQALISYAGYKAALGYNPKSTQDWKGTRYSTRHGNIALLRQRFIKAKQGKAEDPEDIFFQKLLKREEYLRVHLHTLDDLMALKRLAKEFGFRFTVEHGMDFHTTEAFRELKGIPFVYGPLDSFAYKGELRHESTKNILHLIEANVEFSLMSDHPVILQRNLLLTLRWFLPYMSQAEAISLITAKPAKMLGLSKLGTLEPGKWASLVAWDGDPFYLGSRVERVVAEGKIWK